MSVYVGIRCIGQHGGQIGDSPEPGRSSRGQAQPDRTTITHIRKNSFLSLNKPLQGFSLISNLFGVFDIRSSETKARGNTKGRFSIIIIRLTFFPPLELAKGLLCYSIRHWSYHKWACIKILYGCIVRDNQLRWQFSTQLKITVKCYSSFFFVSGIRSTTMKSRSSKYLHKSGQAFFIKTKETKMLLGYMAPQLSV